MAHQDKMEYQDLGVRKVQQVPLVNKELLVPLGQLVLKGQGDPTEVPVRREILGNLVLMVNQVLQASQGLLDLRDHKDRKEIVVNLGQLDKMDHKVQMVRSVLLGKLVHQGRWVNLENPGNRDCLEQMAIPEIQVSKVAQVFKVLKDLQVRSGLPVNLGN